MTEAREGIPGKLALVLLYPVFDRGSDSYKNNNHIRVVAFETLFVEVRHLLAKQGRVQ